MPDLDWCPYCEELVDEECGDEWCPVELSLDEEERCGRVRESEPA